MVRQANVKACRPIGNINIAGIAVIVAKGETKTELALSQNLTVVNSKETGRTTLGPPVPTDGDGFLGSLSSRGACAMPTTDKTKIASAQKSTLFASLIAFLLRY
jgi:hypothetical protein